MKVKEITLRAHLMSRGNIAKITGYMIDDDNKFHDMYANKVIVSELYDLIKTMDDIVDDSCKAYKTPIFKIDKRDYRDFNGIDFIRRYYIN